MPCLIDTNVAIHLRDGDQAVRDKVGALSDTIVLSIISRVELEGGVWRDPALAVERRARLNLLFATLPILSFDAVAADVYRTIVEAAGYSRRKLLDRMIASQAIVHRAKLVTMNAADFNDVPGLEVIEW